MNDLEIRKNEMRTCPICGEDNGCMLSKDCWCHDVQVPRELLDTLPDDKKGLECICKSCIDKYNNDIEELLATDEIKSEEIIK